MPTLATLRLFDANGTPVAAPIAVTLTDPTSAWGIKRDRDNAVIVAAGTATANPSLGVYTYDYGALSLDVNESYTLSFKYNTSSFQSVTIAASQQGVTLRQARRLLSQALGRYQLITTGVQTVPGGVYVGTPTGVDATRRVVSSDLADANKGGFASDTGNTWWEGAFIFDPTTALVRRVTDGGYTGEAAASTVLDAGGTVRVGHLTLSREVGTTALAPGRAIELHDTLPPVDGDGVAGLHTHLNRALEAIRTVKRIPIVAVAGQTRYDLSAYSWLEYEEQVALALEPEVSVGARPSVLGPVEIRRDGHIVYAELPEAQSGTFYLEVYRPAKTWIRSGGTWGDSTVGLVNESDEVAVPLRPFMLLAEYYACRELAQHDPRAKYQVWIERRNELEPRAASLLSRQSTVEGPRHRGLVLSGGRR